MTDACVAAHNHSRHNEITARIHPELCAKCTIEVRKAAVQRNIDDPSRLLRNVQSRSAQSRTRNALMWRYASQPLEDTQEVIRAQAGIASKRAERSPFIVKLTPV